MTDPARNSGPIGWAHERFVHSRRVNVLARQFAELIEPDATVLDVGCGDGLLSSKICSLRPDITMRGIDVLVRDDTAIPVEPFDGRTIPFESASFDSVIMVDVLHHTESAQVVLAEAVRVCTRQIVLKDHYRRGLLAYQTLAFMDRVGNERHGVDIPCNYLTTKQWDELYQSVGARVVACREKLGLYPVPIDWVFGRGLHFVASLQPEAQS